MELSDLLKLSQNELDELFKKSPAGPIPAGSANGLAIAFPGGFLARCIAGLIKRWAWQGKVFTRNPDGNGATLENKVTVAGVQAIVARVYHTESWLDGKDCIVLDYSKTSLLARKIRDEIRLIDPARRLYLGKVWWGKTRLLDFALEFPV
ncbi:MAG: hypothetical protein M3463_05310 [Verrucomicrobiota bacterium]|nr:hypothetical protein [Verrucomicrobiota bacterium]